MQRLVVFRLSLADLRSSCKDVMPLLQVLKKKLKKRTDMYMNGVITNGERYNKVISIWGHATSDIAECYV